MSRPLRIAVLGSTGSIGRSTLEVADHAQGTIRVEALTAHTNLALALRQAQAHRPRFLVATDADRARAFDWSDLPPQTRLLLGQEGVEQVAADPEIDAVVAAMVGSAGLRGTWAAVRAGKRVALANKETLVMAGALVTAEARRSGAAILPVDSEHSAVYQALAAGAPHEVRRIILTASGGPFRLTPLEELERVTVEQALDHPTWEMGRKITIDSATMMNKALEIVEARWLFQMPAQRIDVVIHPQSVVHSMVEYVDGSIVAQLSPPDMRLPIQFALTWPQRRPGPAEKLDWTAGLRLDFEPPDLARFPALALGKEAAAAGGTAGAVLNAANEAAVEGFLAGRLRFTDIAAACRAVIDHHHYEAKPTLERLLAIDGWARQEVQAWISC